MSNGNQCVVQDAPAVGVQRHCSAEVVHGFTLEPGQDASSLRWWPEFVKYFSRVEGCDPHPRDLQHKRLFEYFVEGAFCEWSERFDHEPNAKDQATR